MDVPDSVGWCGVLNRSVERQSRAWGDSSGMVSTIFEYPLVSGTNKASSPVVIATATIVKECTTFSAFPGKVRHHVLLEGETELTVAGEPVVLSGALPRHVFSGAAVTTCRILTAPVVTFNLIVDEDVTVQKLGMLTIAGSAEVVLGSTCETLTDGVSVREWIEVLYCTTGTARVVTNAQDRPGSFTFESGDALVFRYQKDGTRPQPLQVEGSAVLLVAKIAIS